MEETDDRIRSFARKLLAEKRVTFIGSDAHRTTHRPPAVAKGVQYICENCDLGYVADVCHRNAEKYLLGSKHPKPNGPSDQFTDFRQVLEESF